MFSLELQISARDPSSLTITLVSILKKCVGRMKGKGTQKCPSESAKISPSRSRIHKVGTATKEHGIIPPRDSHVPITVESWRRIQATNQGLGLEDL